MKLIVLSSLFSPLHLPSPRPRIRRPAHGDETIGNRFCRRGQWHSHL